MFATLSAWTDGSGELTLYFSVGNNSTWNNNTQTLLNVDQWYHITATFNNNQMKLYVYSNGS
jgi:hypothetical protein